MTELNLRAMNFKKVIATFMAVCLTVLSVNVTAFAQETTTYYDKVLQYDQTTFSFDVATTLNGTVSNNQTLSVSELDGNSGVSVSNNIVSSVDGVINETVHYTCFNNDRSTAFKFSFALVATDKITSEENVLATYSIKQLAKPIDESVSDNDNIGDNDNSGHPVSFYDGVSNNETKIDPEDALNDDYYSNDLVNIVTDNDGKEIQKSGVYTVTILDGKNITKKAPYGNQVAVYTVSQGNPGWKNFTQKIYAAMNEYYEVKGVAKEFTGFGKVSGNEVVNALATEIDDYSVNVNTDAQYVMQYADAMNMAQDVYDITVGVGQKYTLQVVNTCSANKLTVTGFDKKDGIVKSASIKKGSTALLTVKAGKNTGDVTLSVNGIFKNTDPELVAKVNVHVVDEKISNFDGISLQTLTGATSITMDKNRGCKTAQLVALPGTTDVKYIAVDSEISVSENFAKASDATKAIKNAAAKSKAVSVSTKGIASAKKTGTAYVYAYQIAKIGKGAKVVLSNPVKVAVNATAASFRLKGGKTIKYNHFTTSLNGKNVVKDYDKYVEGKGQDVAFTVTAKDTTDKIATRVINNDGKVILGGANRLQTVEKRGIKQDGKYYINILKDADRTNEDNLIVVATAPSGEQHWAKLSYVDR